MSRYRPLLIMVLLISMLLVTGTLYAQGGSREDTERTRDILSESEIPVRDTPELAERLSGIEGATTMTRPPAPAFQLGDLHSFFVGNHDNDGTFEVEAELAAATPGIYLWVEVGVDYDAELLDSIARLLDDALFPAIRQLYGTEQTPGIDGDPHIYILNATNIGRSIGGYFNDASSFPQEIVSTSNEHDMFVIAVDNVPFESSSYIYVLAHEFVHMIQNNEDVNDESWVTEGLAELGAFLTVEPRTAAIGRYFSNPSIQLNGWDVDEPSPYYGSSALFFTYLVERFGSDVVLALSTEQADGITGVDNALATIGATDAVTGEAATFDDVFADWLVANLINNPTLADGRFGYTSLDLNSGAAFTQNVTELPASIRARQVNQFGGEYILLRSDTPQTVTLTFEGNDTVQVVPAEAYSGSHVYWANRSDQSDARLTRAFDLSEVESATLRFQTWYEMEPYWDYAYLSISTDQGATWTVLETPTTTDLNPNSRAFAPGFTGFSSGGVAARPAPFIGISYDPNTGTVTGLVPDAGAWQAGMMQGDKLTAINDVSFAPSQLLNQLNRHRAGDTVSFTVERDDEILLLEVKLGEHPDRVLRPAADWTEETVDLTPYVGGEVWVRFEYVTDQTFTRNGLMLDDISIEEIGFFDDAEGESNGWNSEGWVRIENGLPQEFLVETIQGAETPTISRQLMPGGGASVAWTLDIGPDAPAALIISGMTPYTTQPATYDLTITAE